MPAPGVATPTISTATGPGIAIPPYGHDLWCQNDIDASGLEADGVLALAQALYRRLITPRGQLIDDPNYGTDVATYLDDDVAPRDVARIGSDVDAELIKDERVLRSKTAATLATGGVLNLVTAVTPAAGPTFRLTVAVTSVTSTLLAVGF